MNKQTLIEKGEEIHNNRFDYSLVAENFTTKEKLCIICPEHGVFEKSYEKHINSKQGCPICSGKFRYDTKTFIEKCKTLEDIEYLSFETVDYINNKTKVKIICHCKDENGNEHGEFEITPGHFLSGERCPKCRYIKSSAARRRNINDIIRAAEEVHGGKYDYSKITHYKNDREKLPIICPEHGIFYQTMNNHIQGKQGCPLCGRNKNVIDRTLTTEEFIEKCKIRHGDKYDYSKVDYIKGEQKVIIICPEHGEFAQIARNHLMGQGCPKCFYEKSNFETELLDFIKNLVPDKTIIENNRTILNGKEIDILIPELNIGFEANGLIWHSEKFNFDKNYHLDKTLKCNELGIQLIHVFEDEWYNKNEICKSRISNLLKQTQNTIYARKCEIKEVSFNDCRQFLNENHIQGFVLSKYRYGLYFNNELVSVMTFGKQRLNVKGKNNDNSYELLRFCNKTGYNVIGGASKLFKYFVRVEKPNEIISYADRRWSNGNLYSVLGFEKYNESEPSYFYVVNKKRINRFTLRKDVLVNKYGCPKDVTEKEFCKQKGWYRIYDCGCLCYKWKNKDSV